MIALTVSEATSGQMIIPLIESLLLRHKAGAPPSIHDGFGHCTAA